MILSLHPTTMALLLLSTTLRRATAFVAPAAPSHRRHHHNLLAAAAAASSSSFLSPRPTPGGGGAAWAMPPSTSLLLQRHPTAATALFATTSSASASDKKKKVVIKKKAPPPPPAAARAQDEDEEEDDDDEDVDEMTEEELLKVMQSGEAMDKVWQRMMSQMEAKGALENDNDEDMEELEEEEEEDEEEEEEGLATIQIRNSQRSIDLDTDLLHKQIRSILEILGRADHDVSLWLTNDKSIREYNDRYRGKRMATDILSFPFHEYATPGQPTPESETLNGQIKDLGDMMISTAYVKRACERDQADWQAEGENLWSDERGASGAMATIFDVQGRLPYLIIHGALHLLGHDHETEKEYEAMVTEEERVIREFVARYPEAAPPTLKKKAATTTIKAVGEKETKAKITKAASAAKTPPAKKTAAATDATKKKKKATQT